MKRIAAALLLLLLATVGANAQFAQQKTYGGTSTGTANAQVVTIPNVGSMSNLLGVTISWIPGSGLTNTGATTLAINNWVTTLTPAAVDRMNSGTLVALAGGEMPAGKMMQATWDGTEFILLTNYATGTPTRQVAYFDQSSCPPGWSPANGSGGTINVVGQFIRALNTGSTGYDPNRTLASAQGDSVQPLTWSGSATTSITFAPPSSAYVGNSAVAFQTSGGGANGPGFGPFALTSSMWSAATSVNGTIGGTGIETRPQNVALLACQAN